MATLLEEWLDHIEHLGRSPTTLYGYRRLAAQLPDGFTSPPAAARSMTYLAKAAGVPIKPTDFVFERVPGSGEPLPPSRISQAWQRLCKELGVKTRLHDLRASILLDAGEAITAVAARLGHRDTATTLKVYDHLMPAADSRAAGIVGSSLSRPAKWGNWPSAGLQAVRSARPQGPVAPKAPRMLAPA